MFYLILINYSLHILTAGRWCLVMGPRQQLEKLFQPSRSTTTQTPSRPSWKLTLETTLESFWTRYIPRDRICADECVQPPWQLSPLVLALLSRTVCRFRGNVLLQLFDCKAVTCSGSVQVDLSVRSPEYCLFILYKTVSTGSNHLSSI